MNFRFTGLLLMLVILGTANVFAKDFFSIDKIEYVKKEPKDKIAVYRETFKYVNQKRTIERTFIPCLTLRVRAEEQIRSSGVICRAYFYDRDNKLITASYKPTEKIIGGRIPTFPLPVLFKKNDPEQIFFIVPESIQKRDDWKVLIVFGDQYEVATRVYPDGGSWSAYEFPEKSVAEKPRERPEHKAEMDPLVEYVVKTGSSKQPQMTLFLRPPIGMTDASEAKGVLALCLLANSLESAKRKLQQIEPEEDIVGILKFAQQHQFIILCWGTKRLWDPGKNWDEQSKEVTREMDETFDEVAKAWAKGVDELAKKYGIPNKNFLLWGSCGAGQYACRLALRKPEYFLAVHVHIPGSFDKPTVGANRVLWCLTTGELYGGYERSKKFYEQCRELGYPMVYKAIIGLGHAGHPNADNLGQVFFEYALSLQDQRDAYEESLKDSFGNYKPLPPVREGVILQPWLESFRTPALVGDMVNQDMYPFSQQNMVPTGFRVPLPTKEIAEAWNRK